MINWISVTDRMPSKNIRVLVHAKFNHVTPYVGVGVYLLGEWYVDGYPMENVTHWAEINMPGG